MSQYLKVESHYKDFDEPSVLETGDFSAVINFIDEHNSGDEVKFVRIVNVLTKKVYEIVKAPNSLAKWASHLVYAKSEIKNGLGSIPKGHLLKIISAKQTKYLESANACECCGVKFHFTSKEKKDNFIRGYYFLKEIEE